MTKNKILSRISWFNDFCEDGREPDIVIEAIEEDLCEKQQLFKKIDSVYSPNVILSSATSSLSITEIARFLDRPDRMIGVHFFNPANIMKLVEVVPGERTSEEIIRKTIAFLGVIGKTPIVMPDQPGFLVNRILFLMINESINVLAEGKISAENIDLCMKLGANHPIGPLHLVDMIGLDTCLTILENLYRSTKNPQYKPNPLLIKKVQDHNLGRKTGEGFFNYYDTVNKIKSNV